MGRYTHARDTARLSLVISHPSGGSKRLVSIRIEDEASGLILADMAITPDQFTDLLATRIVHADAEIPNAVGRARLFKTRQFESVDVPKEVGDRWRYKQEPDVKAAVDAWVEQTRIAGGWEIASLALGSQRFYATFELWSDS